MRLPEGSLVYPVFHVSLLKKNIGDAAVISSKLPMANKEGRMQIVPIAILDRKMMKKGNRVVTIGLIQWSNLYTEDAAWKDLKDLQKQFPECITPLLADTNYHSCGQECIQGRSIVIVGLLQLDL